MSRARIHALAMVNWRGIFYERLLFDRAVTALEGTNGAGKTTVMVAVYVALFPDLGKLRFTNLGEHDARSGDRGIYGRLGDTAWPAFTVLDLRVGRGERVLAGVRITRKTEPSVELDPFIVTGLSPSVPLRDVLLDVDDAGQDKLLDRATLNSRVARAGGEISWTNAGQYFRELYDHGVLPLRLISDEDRRRFNHMLRTSMIGGISHTLSGGLRDFVLREDASLADGLRSMRDNLAACQSTRRQIEEEERAEVEVRGVYEAGATMFAAGVHQHRLTADVRREQRAAADQREVEAGEALSKFEKETSAAILTIERLGVELEDAQAAVAEASVQVDRLGVALERVRALAVAKGSESEKLGDAEAAEGVLGAAEAALALATAAAERARARADALSHQLSDQSTAFAELSRRAGLHRQACTEQAILRGVVHAPADALQFAGLEPTLRAEVDRLTKRIYEEDARLGQATHHAAEHLRLSLALEAAEVALATPRADGVYARATRLLAELPGWRQLAMDADRLADESRRLTTQAHEQARARTRAEALLGAGVTGVDVRAAWEATLEAERAAAVALDTAKAAEAALRVQIGEREQKRRELQAEIPAWDGVATLARELVAGSGADLASLADLDRAEDLWRDEASTAGTQVAAMRASAEAARQEASALERAGSALDPRILAVSGAVGGEPVATWYDGVALEDAPGIEARLGPLRDAIVVSDTLAAARRARALPDLPPEIQFVRMYPGEHPAGEIVDGVALVGDGEHTRLTRLPERPALGQAARQARITTLRADADERDTQAGLLDAERVRRDRWLADARRLRAEASRWLAPDPRRALLGVEAALAELRQLAQGAAATRVAAVAEHSAIEARKGALQAVLPHAALLDDTTLPERAATVANRAGEAARLRAALATARPAVEALTAGIEPLRQPPLTLEQRAELTASVAEQRAHRARVAAAADAAEWLSAHPEALDWGDAAALEQTAKEALAGLREEHTAADAARQRATQQEKVARADESGARVLQTAARGARDQAVAWRIRLEGELSAMGLGEPTEADLSAAEETRTATQTRLAAAAARRDEHQQRLGALRAGVAKAAEALSRAAEDAQAARDAEAPAIAAWAALQDAAERADVLSDAYTESARARLEGRGVDSLGALAGQQRVLLLDRLKNAGRGDLVRRTLEERAVSDTPRWSDWVQDWSTVRAWLRERVPPQVSEADDPVRVLRDLALHLASLRQQLSLREGDLRVSSRSIANHLNTAIRAARSLVDRLQEGLEDIQFGSIRQIRVTADTIKPMARILDVLRSDAVQTTLFDAAPTLEQALERIYAQEAGGTIAGHRLLDYREYIELKVWVKRDTERDWTEANGAKMSTGEAIGVGAALMMVVLDAWERRESLGRGKEQRASLRFLFLDEASRLSVDVLRTLFELCDRLELQMLVAAPEVPLSEGNITWRLERVAGKVLVTGRKVEA